MCVSMSLGTHSFSCHRYNLFCSSLKSFSFPKKLLTVPGGSREGENFNLRHKSRDEILREMTDQGYNMKLS